MSTMKSSQATYTGPGTTYPYVSSQISVNYNVTVLWYEGIWVCIEYTVASASDKRRAYVPASTVNITETNIPTFTVTNATRYVITAATAYGGPATSGYPISNSLAVGTTVSYLGKKEGSWAFIEYTLSGIQKTRAYIIDTNLGTAPPPITVNGWRTLQRSQTVSGGRTVNMPSGMNRSTWYSFEGDVYNGKINPYAGTATVIKGSKGELKDGNGRYWVAVGPNVMNPSHLPSQGITTEEMKYQSRIDVVLQNAAGTQYYVPAVVGDCKAHTYPTGIVQTGYAFPNGTDPHPENADGSVIEFMGAYLPSGLSDYSIIKIIIY